MKPKVRSFEGDGALHVSPRQRQTFSVVYVGRADGKGRPYLNFWDGDRLLGTLDIPPALARAWVAAFDTKENSHG